MPELNSFLQPVGAPITTRPVTSAYEFDGVTERNLITNSKVREIIADKIAAGTIVVSVGIGGANVTIDGENSQILVNDGTVDRVLIGKDTDGF